jgi:hypothetical protein
MADETVKLRHTAAQVDDGIDKANAAAPKSTVYTKTEVDTALAAKADSADVYDKDAVDGLLDGKVDVESGKVLSTNDYTNAEKTKLANLENYDDTEVKASIASVRNTAEVTAQEVEDARGTYTSLGERLDDMGGGGGGGTSNYNQLTNKPSINGVTLTGNKTTSDLGIVGNAQADWSQTDSTADDYIKNKPTIPTVNDATLTIQKNGTAVGTFSANAETAATINITVPIDAADVDALPDTTKYGSSLALSIDGSTYVVTATLKDQDGNTLGTAQTIDLPLETVVVGGSYDDTTKKVVLTLKNGNTIDFSVADLVAGLQTEITSANKLDADLVDDTTSVHKFVTAADKTAWNAKSDFSGSYNDLTNKPTIPTVDQTYDSTSTNAQSGVAVAQAVSGKISATDYATQNTGGTIKAWTTTDGSDTILHLATQ